MTARLGLSGNLAFPAELAGRRTAIFGISGSGKSNTATVLIEGLLHAGEQVVLVDPKGEGWGLLSTAAGKPSNLPVVVFGEPNGHIETLSDSHGPRLADFVVETGRSVVLSLLGFESDQSERRFVASFLRQLYRRKSRQGQPTRTLVVLDEAHLFVPENVRGDAAELAGAAQRIARQGRTFGIGTLIVDQRPQDVSKRVITQCDTLICHQLVHKTDRDALRDWVRGYDTDGRCDQFLESLAQLESGEAWVWSPAWLKVFQRVKVYRRKTFDSGAAPDGSPPARAVQRQEIDLDALRGELAEVVERAKADDPRELRKEIAELKKLLAERKPERVEVPVLSENEIARLEKVAACLEEEANKVAAEAAAIRYAICKTQKVEAQPTSAVRPLRSLPRPEERVNGSAEPGSLSRAERALLTALAQRQPARSTRAQVSILSGYSIKSSSFDNALSSLRTAGLIDGQRNDLGISAAGLTALGAFDPPPTGEQVLAWWSAKLGKAERTMLQVLATAYPTELTKDELSARSGYSVTSSSFDNAISTLRTLELIEGRRELRASENLFL